MMKCCSAPVSAAAAPIAILGVPFDHVTGLEAVRRIERMIATGKPHYVVTPNVDFLVQAQSDLELHRILFDAHLVLCDGTPVLWASRLLGNPLPERVAGADLVPALIRVAEQKGYRLFLLGATPESAAQAVEHLRREYPRLQIAGHFSPPFNQLLEMNHAEIRDRIRAAAPDLLLVSMGCPKQEKWIAMNYRSLGVPVSIGCGATIDFLGHRLKRAPAWMRRSGTEWLFRLVQEPRRLCRRYARDLRVFGWKLIAHCWEFRRRRPRSGSAPAFAWGGTEENWLWLKLPAWLDGAAVSALLPPVDRVVAGNRHCLLQMADTRFMDSAGIGFLIRLQRILRTRGCLLILLAPSHATQRALKRMHLTDFFVTAPDFDAARGAIDARSREEATAVTCADGDGSNSLSWRGEITAVNALQVWQATQSHITSSRERELVIDLSGVRFIDSSGMAVMRRVWGLARRMCVELAFVRPQPAVRRLLRLADRDRHAAQHPFLR